MELVGFWSTVTPPLVMTLTFDLWPNQYVLGLGTYIHDPIFVKIFTKIYSFTRFFGSLHVVTFTFDLWSHKLISTSTNPNTSVTKIGWNSLQWVVRYGVHKVFGSLPAVIFGEICSNIYEDIDFSRYFGSLPAVTLTFDGIIMSQAHVHT